MHTTFQVKESSDEESDNNSIVQRAMNNNVHRIQIASLGENRSTGLQNMSQEQFLEHDRRVQENNNLSSNNNFLTHSPL